MSIGWTGKLGMASGMAFVLLAGSFAHADVREHVCKGEGLKIEAKFLRCLATCRGPGGAADEGDFAACAKSCEGVYAETGHRSACEVDTPHAVEAEYAALDAKGLLCRSRLTQREAQMHDCNARCTRVAEGSDPGGERQVACVEHCSRRQARPVPSICAAEDEAGSAGSGETVRGSVQTPGGAIDAELDVQDGLALFEGDIIVGTVEDVTAGETPSPYAAGRRDKKWRWQNNIMPYAVDPAFVVNGVVDARITNAIAHWRANTPLRFVQRSTEADYVYFATGTGCSSWVGRQGGRQNIVMGAGCSTGNMIHEIGHAAGLWHEHTRTDRDGSVTIMWGNIDSTKTYNFQRYVDLGDDGVDMGFFDFGSIMLYDSWAFQRARYWWETSVGPTITRKDGTTYTVQRTALSVIDRAAIGSMYQPNYASISLGTTPNLCLDVMNGNSANRTPIQTYRCNDTAAQKWTATQGTLRAFGKCADMPYDQDGKPIWLFDCWGGWNQQMKLTNLQILTMNNQCVTATTSVWQTQLASCGSTSGQTWTYTPSGEIRTPDGRCLDVMYWDTRNGTPVVGHPCSGGANQKWTLGPNGQIRGYGNKCLDIPGFLDQSGSRLQIWDCHGGINQRFRLKGEIRTLSNKCLEPSGFADWAPVVVHSCDGWYWQKQWTFVP